MPSIGPRESQPYNAGGSGKTDSNDPLNRGAIGARTVTASTKETAKLFSLERRVANTAPTRINRLGAWASAKIETFRGTKVGASLIGSAEVTVRTLKREATGGIRLPGFHERTPVPYGTRKESTEEFEARGALRKLENAVMGLTNAQVNINYQLSRIAKLETKLKAENKTLTPDLQEMKIGLLKTKADIERDKTSGAKSFDVCDSAKSKAKDALDQEQAAFRRYEGAIGTYLAGEVMQEGQKRLANIESHLRDTSKPIAELEPNLSKTLRTHEKSEGGGGAAPAGRADVAGSSPEMSRKDKMKQFWDKVKVIDAKFSSSERSLLVGFSSANSGVDPSAGHAFVQEHLELAKGEYEDALKVISTEAEGLARKASDQLSPAKVLLEKAEALISTESKRQRISEQVTARPMSETELPEALMEAFKTDKSKLQEVYVDLLNSLQQTGSSTPEIAGQKRQLGLELAALKSVIDSPTAEGDQLGVDWNKQIERSTELKAYVKGLGVKITDMKCQNVWNSSSYGVVNFFNRLGAGIAEWYNKTAAKIWAPSHASIEKSQQKKAAGEEKALTAVYAGAARVAEALATNLAKQAKQEEQEPLQAPQLTESGGALRSLGLYVEEKGLKGKFSPQEAQKILGNAIKTKSAELFKSLAEANEGLSALSAGTGGIFKTQIGATAKQLSAIQANPAKAEGFAKDLAAKLKDITDEGVKEIQRELLALAELAKVYPDAKLSQVVMKAAVDGNTLEGALGAIANEHNGSQGVLEGIGKQAKRLQDLFKPRTELAAGFVSDEVRNMESFQLAELALGNDEDTMEALIEGAAQASKRTRTEVEGAVRAQVKVEVERAVGGSALSDAELATPKQVQKAKDALIEKRAAQYLAGGTMIRGRDGQMGLPTGVDRLMNKAEALVKAKADVMSLNFQEIEAGRESFDSMVRHEGIDAKTAEPIIKAALNKLEAQLFVIKAQMPPKGADEDALAAHEQKVQRGVLVLCQRNLAETGKQLELALGASRVEDQADGDSGVRLASEERLYPSLPSAAADGSTRIMVTHAVISRAVANRKALLTKELTEIGLAYKNSGKAGWGVVSALTLGVVGKYTELSEAEMAQVEQLVEAKVNAYAAELEGLRGKQFNVVEETVPSQSTEALKRDLAEMCKNFQPPWTFPPRGYKTEFKVNDEDRRLDRIEV